MEFVIDEGFSGVAQEYGATVASFGMAEKGSDLVSLMVDTPGGHSSVPPVHTGSELLRSHQLCSSDARDSRDHVDPA